MIFFNHVASDIGIHQQFLPSENFCGQKNLDAVENWTRENKMKLNVEKTNLMVFNFTKDHQFCSRLYLEGKLLETVHETKLLGTIITSDLKWERNTDMLTKKAYQRMEMLRKLRSFGVKTEDLVTIYVLYIRSILELNCQVWHYSLTIEDETNIERVQKVACFLILHQNYLNYEQALVTLNLTPLKTRREHLCLNFARKCLKHPTARKMFPQNTKVEFNLRSREKFQVQHTNTDRLLHSSIPQLQRALNKDAIRRS